MAAACTLARAGENREAERVCVALQSCFLPAAEAIGDSEIIKYTWATSVA